MPAFDTYEYISDLEKSGVGREQAEALSKAHIKIFRDLMEEKLATKEDLQSVKTELKQEIASVKTELKQEIASVKADLEVLTYKLTIRMGGMFATSIVILGALIRFGH